eukprot:1315238-Amorphochlora_amoeboformis.AAC.1
MSPRVAMATSLAVLWILPVSISQNYIGISKSGKGYTSARVACVRRLRGGGMGSEMVVLMENELNLTIPEKYSGSEIVQKLVIIQD